MASFTLSSCADVFPVGTTVGAYPARYRLDGSSPSGSATTTAVVASSGSLAFTGLANDTDYVAYALVGGSHKYRGFQTSRPRYTGLEIVGPITDGDAPVWSDDDDALVATSVASGDEAVYRSRGVPSVLDHNAGVAPDGTADNTAVFEAAAADAIARGKGQVVVPATANAWRISRPLPLTVDWIGFGRHATGTRIKATADFDGTKMFDIDSTSNVLRRVAHMRIDCSMVPGLRAIGSDDAFGAGVGRLSEVHIISVAPTIVTRLASGVTLGGTKVLSVEDATRFRPGIVKFAGSGSALSVTEVDEEANTITVSNGSGTYSAGHALEQPVWAIEAGPHSGASATGAMVGWIFDGVQLNNCAHLLRLPVTAGDDLNVVNFRSAPVDTAAVSKTLSADFVAGTDTTVSLNSTSGLRPSGRVIVGGEDVWYTAISGSTLTGIYTAHVGTISSGATVEQFARPIDAPFDIDGVNMRFESVYTQLGMTDDLGSGGIKALWKIGGQVAHLANFFPEEVPTGHNFTHLFFAQQPSCALEIDGISPNFDTASDYVAMVRTQLASMSAAQRKYIAIRNYRPDSTDVSDLVPLVDLFVGSDAESNGNALDLHVEGVNAATKIGRFGAASTVTSAGAGVVRVTGTWKGQRLDDRLACLTADADWPDIISHYVLSSGAPESSVTARPGSTLHSRRLGTGVASFYPVFSRKLSGSGNTGWVGDYYGTGRPDFDAPIGSVYINLTTGLRWYKIATTSAGWVTGSEVSLQGWLADDIQTVTLGIVPVGAVMLSHSLYVHEAFNSDGTDSIRAGHDAGVDTFIADTDVATTGYKTASAGTGGTYRTSAVTAKAYYVNGGSEPTTGKALVTVRFSFPPPIPA